MHSRLSSPGAEAECRAESAEIAVPTVLHDFAQSLRCRRIVFAPRRVCRSKGQRLDVRQTRCWIVCYVVHLLSASCLSTRRDVSNTSLAFAGSVRSVCRTLPGHLQALSLVVRSPTPDLPPMDGDSSAKTCHNPSQPSRHRRRPRIPSSCEVTKAPADGRFSQIEGPSPHYEGMANTWSGPPTRHASVTRSTAIAPCKRPPLLRVAPSVPR